jgi:hypothetical protein
LPTQLILVYCYCVHRSLQNEWVNTDSNTLIFYQQGHVHSYI